MSFRRKLTVLTAAAIALTVAVASGAAWVAVGHDLRGQVDRDLRARAEAALSGRPLGPLEPGTVLQPVAPNGTSEGDLPVPSRVRRLAEGQTGRPFFMDMNVSFASAHVHARIYAVPTPGGGAIAIWRNVNDDDHVLHRLGFTLFIIGIGGVALAAALAAFVAAAALRPIRRLTAAAETVASTGRLTERVAVGTGHDELARLATRFNEMLSSLESSVSAQRHLVADASHELRTPLTAARTNVDLVLEGRLPPAEGRQALIETSAELNSLTSLIGDLVELARGEERKLRIEDVHLDELVTSAVDRVRTRAPSAVFVTSISPSFVSVDPVLIERAIFNLLDNAVKYSPVGAPIEITVRSGKITVQDHGQGIAEEDLPRIFDRFYRAASARATPGSGLGLAIVREAAEAHGGTATVETTATGTRFTLSLKHASA
jgi:two-component system, OmpR family, sensor histidine kinase MprB